MHTQHRLVPHFVTVMILFIRNLLFYLVFLNALEGILSHPFRQQRCSNHLENALEHMRRRTEVKTSRSISLSDQSPYGIYHSIYSGGNSDADKESFYNGGDTGGDRGYYAKNIQHNRNSKKSKFSATNKINSFASNHETERQPHKLTISKVDVEDLRVRLPKNAPSRWVEVDKCAFRMENSTLDTRLVFPDLTISGKVVMQATGGKCHMILRLRHAGIDFRTVPIGFDFANEESRRIGSASVRTDSHFAEPGFISVFVHDCQGPTGIKVRQNSKRRFGFTDEQYKQSYSPSQMDFAEPPISLGTSNTNRWDQAYNPGYDIRTQTNRDIENLMLNWNRENKDDIARSTERHSYGRHFRYKRNAQRRQSRNVLADEMNFDEDILNIDNDFSDLTYPTDARAFTNVFNANDYNSGDGGEGAPFTAPTDNDEVNEALTSELEKIFSMGVRGLLTTYMQRALQPLLKQTLMENMGYKISYG